MTLPRLPSLFYLKPVLPCKSASMTLELYIWGPAFSLPSIDPQCLAALAYISCRARQSDGDLQWHVIASNDTSISPSSMSTVNPSGLAE